MSGQVNSSVIERLAKQYNCKIWVARDGSLIPTTLMSDLHLRSAWLTAWVNDRPDFSELTLAQGCFILGADDAYLEVTLPANGEDGRLTLSPHMADQLAHLLAAGEKESRQPLRLQ